MKLQAKVYIITAIIFLLHFIVSISIDQQQIKTEVLDNIKDNARNIRGILMAYRGVYQKVFINHQVPINDTTLEFLPAYAISRISTEFTQWVNTGLSFNTVSDNPRNPRNMADKVELEAMNYFRMNKSAQERFVPFINKNGEPYYHFSQPIYIESRCLKCHGKKDQAPESIQQRYDTAYNYKLGDLRGLMSIKLPSKIIQQRIDEQFKNSVIIHLATFLFSLLLISILMNKTVLSRIKNLQISTEQLAKGDYTTQINITGNDELTQVGQSFNKMTQTIAQREQSLLKQKSLYQALSQTNKSIILFNDKQKLFEKICQIATTQAHLNLAWVGLVDNKQSRLNIIASSGNAQACLQKLEFILDEYQNGPTKPAVKAYFNKKIIIINDYINHPETKPQHHDAQQENIHAVAALPILKDNKVIGVFSVYADQIDYFSSDIVTLLEEMARDIEYAIRYYELQQQHQSAQKQLQQSSFELAKEKDFMRLLLESTGEGIFGVDVNGLCTFVNQAALKMFGFTFDEMKGQCMHQLTHHHHQDGQVYPQEECPVYNAFKTGHSKHIENDVFWRKDGSFFPVEYSTYPIRNNQQETTGSVTIFRDVTESQLMKNKMNFLAKHDSLTGLLNRYSFEQHLAETLESTINDDSVHAACYLDLDQFKVVNDTCGHLAGDEMLKLIAHLLKENVRRHDILARLGGDEFGLLLKDCSLEQATELGQKLCNIVKEFRFPWDGKVFSTGVSIGICAITQESESVQYILSNIDSACYIAKEKGRNRVHVIQPDDTETARRHGEMRWVSEIRSALEENRLMLYKQAIVPAKTHNNSVHHYEILLRMLDRQGNIILPGAFLPAAERYDLMLEIDHWVIKSSFNALSSNALKIQENKCFCSINLSGQSLGDPTLYDFIINQKNNFQIAPQSICFEITESAAITHLEQAIEFIHKLKVQGFLFALDDFGTGMSSFAYLKNLPVNFLKIDGSFIRDILDDPIDRAMVKSINDIGHIMGLQTIAEYVEDDQIIAELSIMEIDYLQGYAIARPEPL